MLRITWEAACSRTLARRDMLSQQPTLQGERVSMSGLRISGAPAVQDQKPKTRSSNVQRLVVTTSRQRKGIFHEPTRLFRPAFILLEALTRGEVKQKQVRKGESLVCSSLFSRLARRCFLYLRSNGSRLTLFNGGACPRWGVGNQYWIEQQSATRNAESEPCLKLVFPHEKMWFVDTANTSHKHNVSSHPSLLQAFNTSRFHPSKSG